MIELLGTRKGAAMTDRTERTETNEGILDRLVTLADTLVTGFDVVDLADQLVRSCQEFLPVRSVGIMLDDQRGGLRVLASSSEEMRVLELFELQSNEGPCLEAFYAGELVESLTAQETSARWPRFAEAARPEGIVSTYAFPMRLRDRTIGALNLFCDREGGLSPEELRIAHAMTTMATLGILNHWSVRRQELLAEQLQTALTSRIVIEQAKGVVAERSGVDMAEAFDLLRAEARRSRRPLSELADDVANGRTDLRQTVGPPVTPPGTLDG